MAAACDAALAATDVADYLVGRGVPFREAHHLTGTLVRRCLEAGVTLSEMSLGELQTLSPAFDETYYRLHDPAAALARKRSRRRLARPSASASSSSWRAPRSRRAPDAARARAS